MRHLLLLLGLLLAAACNTGGTATDSPDASPAEPDAAPDGATGCPVGKAGAACILALYDRASACDADVVSELRLELDARAELGPLWANGRALFRTLTPTYVAGTFNQWSQTALHSAELCNSNLVVAVGPVASGFHQYKLFDGQSWTLDGSNRAFAYDDFSGNPEGQNSVLATPDSGRGYLVKLANVCSAELGNCRDVTAYLPAGYDALEQVARTYPVLVMHDGQNVFDDHDCCFGHTGWETNVALDREIADGHVAPVIVVAVGMTSARNQEYGLSEAKLAAFMAFIVDELQPRVLREVRWNEERLAVAGSSLGGLVAMYLALTYPETFGSAAALSGAFWPGMESGTALRDKLATLGKQPIAIYLDHGGNVANNSDGAADTVELRNRLLGMGWQGADSPTCTPGPDALCYHSEPGATHDELAWRARTWRFLRFMFPG